MPSGIILSSGSQGATQKDIEKVLTEHGYEPETVEAATTELVEPKPEDFENDEAFEAAKEEFDAKQEEAEKAAAEKEEKEEDERAKTAAMKQPSRRQRAIDKATKKLQDDLRAANDRIAAYEKNKGGAEVKTETVKAPEQPKREAFKSDAEFEEAMFDWRYKMRRAKEQADEAALALKSTLEANFENYKTQVAAFKEEHDDWDEVVNQNVPIHESVYLGIIEQENGAAVTYYLGKHPDYARKLAGMTPLAAVMEIGRLAEKLKAGAPERRAANPNPSRRNLPEPVKGLSTSATSSTLTSRDAAKNRDYRAFKAAQRRGA